MKLSRALVPALFLFLSVGLAAQDLHLVPAPRELTAGTGSFEAGVTLRLAVGARHAAEDRFAAETVAEEIANQTGRKVHVVTGAVAPGPGTILFARTDEPGIAARLKKAKLEVGDSFDEEGYVLESTKSEILVAARTGAGVFYGAQTLRQLLHGVGKKVVVPAVAIRDWPAMRWRGVHDDISRGPIPTLDFMKKEVRTLAEYKINLFALYMEHVFEYQSQPLVAPHEASITPAMVKELVEYARPYHVTIMPEQEPFGHLHHVLKYEIYQDIAETPHGHVITPTNPASFDFVKSMFDELSAAFPGQFFHIGSDETFELGQGKTKDLAAQEGLGKVYLDDIVKLYDIMKPHHKRLLFWGDVAEKYPQLLGALPKDLIANPWTYGAAPDYSNKIKPFRDAGLDVFVSPGSNSWYHIWPDFDVAFVNVRNFVRDGQKFNALGMLNTTWDDDGEAFFGSTWPAMTLGAACSWQPGECSIEKFLDSYDWAFYRNAEDHSFRDIILSLNSTNKLMKQVGAGPASNDEFWLNPFTPEGAQLAGRTLPIMHDLRLAAENALISLRRNGDKAHLHADTLQYMNVAAMRMDLLGMKVQMADEINHYYRDAVEQKDRAKANRDFPEISATNGRLQDLRDATTRARKFYSDLWLSESQAYWLGNVQVRYDRLALIYVDKIEQVKAAQQQFRQTGTLPPPEQLGFFNPIAPPPPRPRNGQGAGGQPPTQPPPGQLQPTAPPTPPAPAEAKPAVPGTGQIAPTEPKPAPPPSQKPPGVSF